MNTARLPLLSFLLGLSFVTLLAPATSAQDYPNRPIRFIVGFPPSGSVDVLARAVANQATKTLGQPILVENRARASTNAASDFVAKERPDGYTVLVASDSIAINASLFKNLSFNPVTSFAPVTLAITSPQILVVRANFGVQTVAEYLTKVKANPGGVNVGLTGRGTIGHLTSELINQGGLKVSYVPYTGGTPAVRDLVGGHTDALYVTLPGVAGSVRGGNVIPVAVSSPKRYKAFPDVPTFAETAAPELSIDSWQGPGSRRHASADHRQTQPGARRGTAERGGRQAARRRRLRDCRQRSRRVRGRHQARRAAVWRDRPSGEYQRRIDNVAR